MKTDLGFFVVLNGTDHTELVLILCTTKQFLEAVGERELTSYEEVEALGFEVVESIEVAYHIGDYVDVYDTVKHQAPHLMDYLNGDMMWSCNYCD